MKGYGHRVATILFLGGLGLLLMALLQALPFGGAPMQVGQAIVVMAPAETGATNIVTAILLGYRGLDTLGEVSILFVAATAAGMVLGGAVRGEAQAEPAGFILRSAAWLLFPFLLVLGAYIVIHGHLTPGGGFQGGAVLAAAFFVPLLANPASPFNHRAAMLVEGFAGVAFIVIGLFSLLGGGAFLTPLLGKGDPGALFSAGSLPLLYLAIGLKVGSELAGLMARVAGGEASS
jgi:multicomponent Na+:H+ antiporter subunit B